MLGAAVGGLLSWAQGRDVREGAALGVSAGLVGGSLMQVPATLSVSMFGN